MPSARLTVYDWAVLERHILPSALGIQHLHLPAVRHRHAAAVGPEVGLHLAQRHGGIPRVGHRRVPVLRLTPVVPRLHRVGALEVDDAIIEDGHVTDGVAVAGAGLGGRLGGDVHGAVGGNAVHGHIHRGGLLAVGGGQAQHVVAFDVECHGRAGGLVVHEGGDAALGSGDLRPGHVEVATRQTVILDHADDFSAGTRCCCRRTRRCSEPGWSVRRSARCRCCTPGSTSDRWPDRPAG